MTIDLAMELEVLAKIGHNPIKMCYFLIQFFFLAFDFVKLTDSYSGGETDGGYWKYGDSSGLDGVPIDVIADDISAIS